MLTWNYVAYFLTLVFFLFQQFVADYYMYAVSRGLLIAVVFDLVVFVAFVMNHSSDYAASKGSTCWVLYTWLMAFKVVISCFVLDNNLHGETGFLMESGRFELYTMWFFIPAIYALLSFRACEELFGGVKTISTESMLHADLVLHVLLDLWDLGGALVVFLTLPYVTSEEYQWIQYTGGSLIPAAIFLHGYSFASVGQRDECSISASSVDAGDVLLTRKHAAVIGIFIIDVPLVAFRFFAWAAFPSCVRISPFIVKNILCVLVQSHRLRQTTTATRLKESRQRRSKTLLDGSRRVSSGGRRSIGPRLREVKHVRIKDTIEEVGGVTRAGTTVGLQEDGKLKTDENRYKLELSRQDQVEEIKQMVQIVKDARAPRQIPVDSIRCRKVVRKMIHCLRCGGGRPALALLLDNVMRIGFWRQLLLAFPFMLNSLCQIAIVAVLYFFYDSENPSFPIKHFSIGGFSNVIFWDIPIELRVCFYICGACLIWNCICWISTAPILDVIFICIFSPLQMLSFALVVMTFRDFAVFNDIFHLRRNEVVDGMSRYLIWTFALEPVLGVLYTLYPSLCALLGKEYLGYVVASSRTSLLSKLKKSAKFSRDTTPSPKRSMEEEYSNVPQPKRGDEFGVMTTTSLIIFINCRFAYAPVSVHELLMGPNMIKSVNMNDAMLQVHFRSLCLTAMLRFWCCTLLWAYPNSVAYGTNPPLQQAVQQVVDASLIRNNWNLFSIAYIIFAAHLAFLFWYGIASQLVRLLALRRYEIKSMFQDLVDSWNRKRLPPHRVLEKNAPRSPLDEEVAEREVRRGDGSLVDVLDGNTLMKLEAVEEIREKYTKQSAFTSPGNLFPTVL